jgi:hypothetical protein
VINGYCDEFLMSFDQSEDEGQGGEGEQGTTRRKKKGLKEKIKERLTGGKQKDENAHATAVSTTTTTTASSTSPTSLQHHEHEKKSVMEKIKEKLPGHHGT